MLTPQQVAEKTFSANDKRNTGYDMQEVDAFLDEITADYAALVNENADLRIKLKLLADKVTEYRETENAIRATLYTAQKTATNLVSEAQQKREAILNSLEEDIHTRKDAYSEEIEDCHRRLAAARAQTADYVEAVRRLTADHQRFLDALPPEIVGGSLPDEYEEEDAAAVETAEQAVEEITATEEDGESAAEPSLEVPEQDESAPASRIDFSNLQFGKDYEV